MKKVILLFVSFVWIATPEAEAKKEPDAKEKKEPVVMTVAGKDVPLSEFIFMAKKDNSVDFKDKKTVANYVEIFKNYKLKVVDAEAMSIQKTSKFENELKEYTFQLQQSYLVDKAGQDSSMRVIYERAKIVPGIKQIFFSYPKELIATRQILTKDTAALYEKAVSVYNRIKNGEVFEEVGESSANGDDILYMTIEHVFPIRFSKKPEDCIYAMEPGSVSGLIRSPSGFHVFKSDRIIPNPGEVQIAHVLSAFPSGNPTDEEIEETRKRSDEIYRKAVAGESFTTLVETFSEDTILPKGRGGLFPPFGLSSGTIESIEKAAFALENIGDISKPVQTRYGFHVLKLVDRKADISFEELESEIFTSMRSSDRVFDLYHSFEERMKAHHKYVFYPEAYEELERLADEYFPLDSIFIARGLEMQKVLICIDDSLDFTQDIFVEYLVQKHRTTHMYSLDFMQDVFRYFVREILTQVERLSLERDYPEYNMTLKEYYDGILLFEVSNKRVWSRPPEEQEQLEAEWVKELNEKYPVTINWKAIKKIKKV